MAMRGRPKCFGLDFHISLRKRCFALSFSSLRFLRQHEPTIMSSHLHIHVAPVFKDWIVSHGIHHNLVGRECFKNFVLSMTFIINEKMRSRVLVSKSQ